MRVRLIFAFCLLVCHSIGVLGHGALSSPAPRTGKKGDTPRGPAYTCDGPRDINPTFSQSAHRCGDASTPTTLTKVTAGSNLDISWNFEAVHPGDCALWISYDDNKESPENWVKLADFLGCGADNELLNNPPSSFTVSVPISENLPVCEHCVMRWSWYAVQQVSNVEFYVDCFDVEVASSQTGNPIPTTAITGIDHLGDCPFYNVYSQHDVQNRMRGPQVWGGQVENANNDDVDDGSDDIQNDGDDVGQGTFASPSRGAFVLVCTVFGYQFFSR